jgi:hypothetical protein
MIEFCSYLLLKTHKYLAVRSKMVGGSLSPSSWAVRQIQITVVIIDDKPRTRYGKV